MNERVLDYGTRESRPRRRVESGWLSLLLSIVALVLVVMGMNHEGFARATGVFWFYTSVASSVGSILLGLRSFWRRERSRPAVIFALVFLLPVLAFFVFALAWVLGYLRIS